MSPTSARGLFRATGKKGKPVAARHLDGSYGKVPALERAEDDFFPTPPEATRAFLAAELGRLRDFEAIWEPAAGDGAMVREMEAVGLKVRASDIIDRGCGATICSFYDFIIAGSLAIVTNPPFFECSWGNGKARWLKHALGTLDVEYMALLMAWQWPGAAGLAPFWAHRPPSRVYLMRWRIDFTGQGAAPALHAWFVWDRQHCGETVLRMMDRADARQGNLFETEAAE
jgi:hypothetical protein